MKPKLLCYASTPKQIHAFINAGASDIIIEDARLSVRSMQHPWPPTSQLRDIISKAKQTFPNKQLWINIEKIAHPHDIKSLTTLITRLKKDQVNAFRIQDLGVLSLFKSIHPKAKLWYAPEFGYSSIEAIKHMSPHCHVHHISNDCPITNIKKYRKTSSQPLSIQIFGPILIQYSQRRYISYLENTQEALISTITDT